MSQGAAASQLATLRRILGDHLTCRARLDLLVFWGRYPGGWFGRRAVSPFTRSSRKEIRQALDELVDEGIIQCRRDGEVSYYALAQDVRIRGAVKELPRLTPNERRYLLHLSARRPGEGEDQRTDVPSPGMLRQVIEGAEP